MKKNLTLAMVFFSIIAFSQVGINTPNPQGTLHVDGAKDNPATGIPTDAQQANDFTVTSEGNVGIGNITPLSNLHIKNRGTATGIGGGEATNTGLLIENPIANSSILSILRTTGTRVKQAVMGINPNFNGNNGVFIISRGPGGSDWAMDLTTGNIGIATNSPTQAIDINGGARIRTINSNAGTTADNIVVADAAGVLKVVSDLPRRSVYSTAAIASGGSETLTITDPNFSFSQINIVAGNACARTMITTFSKYGNTLNYLGGQARDITGQFTQLDANGNNISVKFPGVLNCADGGNGTQFDFDILVNGNNITITNRGNIAKTFSVRVISNL
ncbi:hypothetical protein [Chryseobacterium sp.]|uniref:hypothetical protein n=1 Tax=Chryseobacterium sp. TaxID=1871047 RepID=UPI0035B3F97A